MGTAHQSLFKTERRGAEVDLVESYNGSKWPCDMHAMAKGELGVVERADAFAPSLIQCFGAIKSTYLSGA